MNNLKTNLKEDMFKAHPILGGICANFIKLSDDVLNRAINELTDFQVTKVNQGYLGNLPVIDGSGSISKSANVVIENRTCKITLDGKDQKKISAITKTIEEKRGLTVTKNSNVLVIVIPDPTEDRRKKTIKEMEEHIERYIGQINSMRTSAISELKKIEDEQKNNSRKATGKNKAQDKMKETTIIGVSEDDIKKCKQLIDQIKEIRIGKLNILVEKQKQDIISGKK